MYLCSPMDLDHWIHTPIKSNGAGKTNNCADLMTFWSLNPVENLLCFGYVGSTSM